MGNPVGTNGGKSNERYAQATMKTATSIDNRDRRLGKSLTTALARSRPASPLDPW
jgi:hypothetical protein